MKKRALIIFFSAGVLFNIAFAAPRQDLVNMKADELNYDHAAGVVTSKGNVEIYQNGNLMMADKVVYNSKADMVTASGNISLVDGSGNVYFAENVQLKDKMKEGVIKNLKARLSDNSALAANSGTRESATKASFEKTVYSPCKLCEEDPTKAPFWQVKADKVKIDDDKEKITYKNAFLELYGIPVLYSPFLSHPTPTAKKQSGLLAPTYGSTSQLGVIISTPYFYNIAPNIDATINPIFTSKEGVVMAGDLRHLTENGFYELKGSITNPDKRNALGERIAGDEIRGHIEGKGNFTINNNWDWGFDAKKATDDTYTRRYKFGEEDYFRERAYVQKVEGRTYILAESIGFQELKDRALPGSTPMILPTVKTRWESTAGYKGGRFSFDTDMMNLAREEGTKSRRLSATSGFRIPFISRSGHLFEASAKLRGDVYSIDNDVAFNSTNASNDSSTLGRFIPEAKLAWSLPLVKNTNINNIFLEPIANIIVSPNGGNPNKIPNEDSQELELSDVNLFDSSRFAGLDRVETGTRVNYGVRAGIYGKTMGNINLLFGQNYHFREDENFNAQSGLNDNLSDYVGRLMISDGRAFDFAYRFRLDNETFSAHRSEFSVGLNVQPLKFTVDYIILDDEFSRLISTDSREEITTAATFEFSNNWVLYGNVRRDLSENGGFISSGGGLLYQNDCITIINSINREFTRDRDIEPSTSISVKLLLKNLN